MLRARILWLLTQRRHISFGLAFGLAVTLLVVLGNIRAWSSYFQGDDFDTLSWAKNLPFTTYLSALVTPFYFPNHFRPVGHILYKLLDPAVGLRFGPYLAVAQALHLLNVFLLWRVLRRFGFAEWPAAFGVLFFAFHMATLDACWKPQFWFDVLCTTFCLACLDLYMRGRFVLSLICMWLAYKSKELAVMLPFVLVAYELWFGKRRWKPLLAFLALGLWFGLQGVIVGGKTHVGTSYALHFTWKAIGQTAAYYFSKIFMTRWAGFLVLLIPLFMRDRRGYFGLAIFLLFLVPLLPLSGRVVELYLYLPLTGLSFVLASLASSPRGLKACALFLAFWMPWSILHSRRGRRIELAAAAENRAYVSAARKLIHQHPAVHKLLFSGAPHSLAFWGARGVLLYFDPTLDLRAFDEPDPAEYATHAASVVQWNSNGRTLDVVPSSELESIALGDAASAWQLGTGWLEMEGISRWLAADGKATLYAKDSRPLQFRCRTIVTRIPKGAGAVVLSVLLNGHLAGEQRFAVPGQQVSTWPVELAAKQPVAVEFRVQPAQDHLVAVAQFGLESRP